MEGTGNATKGVPDVANCGSGHILYLNPSVGFAIGSTDVATLY